VSLDDPGATALPRPRLGRDVVVLGVVAFFVMVGFGVVVPVLPVFARRFGADGFQVGAVVSAFALVRFAASPLCGRLVRRGGERTVLATGIFVVAASSVLVGLAQTYAQVLVLRAVGGIGSAMFSVSAMTLLLGTTPVAVRGRAVGFYQGGFLVGGMAGPAVGGVLALVSLRAPFFFYGGTLVVAGLVGLLFLQPSRGSAQDDDAGAARPWREVARNVRFRAACLANLAQGWSGVGVRSTLVPLVVVEVLHRDTAWSGIAFAVAAVVQTLMLGPAGTYVDRVGRRSAVVVACAVGGLALLGLAFSPDVWVLMALLCLYGACAAFVGTAPAALVGDVAGQRSGEAVAVFSMCSDLGAITGPLVAGWLADVASFPVAFGSATVIMLVAAGYARRIPHGRAPRVA